MDFQFDIIHFYPEGCDRFAYLKEYALNKFLYLSPEESIGPSLSDEIGYICQWTVDEIEGTFLYIVTDKSNLYMYSTCEETPVSIFVWNDTEEEDFSNYDVTRPIGEIFSYIEDALGWFAYISENYFTKQVELSEKNKVTAEESGMCAVCLEDYTEGEKVIRLIMCKHVFCENCITTWLKSNATCPLCRSYV